MSLYKVLGQVGHPGTAAGIARLTATKETVDEDPDVGFADANLGAATTAGPGRTCSSSARPPSC